MSRSGDKAFLSDMLDCAQKVAAFIEGYDEAAYLADDRTKAAVAHMLQTIGEASRKVSQELQFAHPEIDWLKIQGLRHRIVHDYRRIDDATIWRIANRYVPPLVIQLMNVLEAEG
jgi:uncharacterized protein with HEPN domain